MLKRAAFRFFSCSQSKVKPQCFKKCVKSFYPNALFAALPVQHLRGERTRLTDNKYTKDNSASQFKIRCT